MQSLLTDDGYHIYFDICGEGSPLLLIHGWSLDSRMWASVVPKLAEYFQVITIDRRGFGQSDGVPSKSKDLEDIDALLNHLNIDTVSLIGMSQGGRVALNYCLTRPQKVCAMVLQGSQMDGYSPEGSKAEQIPLEDFKTLVEVGQLDELRASWLKHPLMAVPENSSELKQSLRTMLKDYQAKDLQLDIAELRTVEINAAARLQEIQCPVIVIDGETEIDPIKQVSEKLLAGLSSVQKITIRGGGHLISMIQPQAFSKVVIDFLSSATT